jgi:RNA polymerase sigma-70 factor (ECF subfamily)
VTATDDLSGFGEAATAPEVGIDLERAIASLPPALRTVFVLHDVEGYPHDEIANLTGQSPVTARVQLHRARKLLREALSR